jgi:hypothetical protein
MTKVERSGAMDRDDDQILKLNANVGTASALPTSGKNFMHSSAAIAAPAKAKPHDTTSSSRQAADPSMEVSRAE